LRHGNHTPRIFGEPMFGTTCPWSRVRTSICGTTSRTSDSDDAGHLEASNDFASSIENAVTPNPSPCLVRNQKRISPESFICHLAQRRQYTASKGRRLLRVGRPKGANMIGLLDIAIAVQIHSFWLSELEHETIRLLADGRIENTFCARIVWIRQQVTLGFQREPG
jgi:hypothetical protein